METIPYKTLGIVSKTPCPHKHLGKSGNVAYVGSGTCSECPHFVGIFNKDIIGVGTAVNCNFK